MSFRQGKVAYLYLIYNENTRLQSFLSEFCSQFAVQIERGGKDWKCATPRIRSDLNRQKFLVSFR